MREESAESHFGKRADNYNTSSSWVADKILVGKMIDCAEVSLEKNMLDLATGTGLVAAGFKENVKAIIGVDISKEMIEKNIFVDRLEISFGEELPFSNEEFDIVTCRQGLQFMDLKKVLNECRRVLKPGGKIVLAHLTAYGPEDEAETFEIQRLRNPSRLNCFSIDEIPIALQGAAFKEVEIENYKTRESISQWTNIGALTDDRINKIENSYKNASDHFLKKHEVIFEDGDIFDSMNMQIVSATK